MINESFAPGAPAVTTKACTKCKITKPHDDFYAHKGTRDKKASWCKVCLRRSLKAYMATDAGKLSKKRSRARYKEGSGRFSLAKAKTEKKDRVWDLSREDYATLTRDPCYFCRGPSSRTGVGLVRRNPRVAYTFGNVVPACRWCMMLRMGRCPRLWFREISTVGLAFAEVRARRREKRYGVDGEAPDPLLGPPDASGLIFSTNR